MTVSSAHVSALICKGPYHATKAAGSRLRAIPILIACAATGRVLPVGARGCAGEIEDRLAAHVVLVDSTVSFRQRTRQTRRGDRDQVRPNACLRGPPQAESTRTGSCLKLHRHAPDVGVRLVPAGAFAVGETRVANPNAPHRRRRARVRRGIARLAGARRFIGNRALNAGPRIANALVDNVGARRVRRARYARSAAALRFRGVAAIVVG
jgi:hypothetical protein